MKVRLRLLTSIAALVLLPSLTAAGASEQPWVFEGGGWGHGIGMSQFGALGQAEDGRSVEQILQHYYQGVSIAQIPPDHWINQSEGLWVGLEAETSPYDGGSALHFEAIGPGTVTICQPANCSGFQQTVTTGDTWHFDVQEDPDAPGQEQCRVRRGTQATGGQSWDWDVCNAKVTQPNGTGTRIEVNGVQHAHGTVRMTPSTDGFHTVLALSLENYLYGLSEVPSTWPATVLEVQAITGRSYAVATAVARGGSDGSGKLSSCGCHLRPTSQDQVYAGWSKESPANYGDAWKAAVDATAHEVITHPQSNYAFNIAQSFYSSSNGGASENNEDVWGGTALPWLRSVDDPWSADPDVNPLATWSVRVSDSAMAAYFGWDRALDAFVLQGPPDVRVKFTGWDNGGSVSTTLNGSQLATLVKTIGFGYVASGSTSTAIRVSPYFTAVTDPPGFDDIIGSTFEADIDWAGAVGVTKGCNPPANTKFCPGDAVTRGQMAAFLRRYLDLPAPSQDHFGDDSGSTFESDINALADAGITKGCNPPANTKFCPDDRVSREQMAAFIVRAFDLKANSHPGFNDVSASNTFYGDILKLGTAGVTKGCNPPANTLFCPTRNVTRGEMAAFLHRADGLD